MDQIFITNKNDFYHEDKFNGQVYAFPPGERATVPLDAAAHMFGAGKADKTETLVRLGWANRYNTEKKNWEENTDGIKWLANFIITQGMMVEVPVDQSVIESAASAGAADIPVFSRQQQA